MRTGHVAFHKIRQDSGLSNPESGINTLKLLSWLHLELDGRFGLKILKLEPLYFCSTIDKFGIVFQFSKTRQLSL